jgi:hypothetical protein
MCSFDDDYKKEEIEKKKRKTIHTCISVSQSDVTGRFDVEMELPDEEVGEEEDEEDSEEGDEEYDPSSSLFFPFRYPSTNNNNKTYKNSQWLNFSERQDHLCHNIGL